MDFGTAVRDQISLLEQGKPLEAFDRYFDDAGLLFDNDEPSGRGKDECRTVHQAQLDSVQNIVGNITSCSMDIDSQICAFRNQSVLIDASGQERQLDGVHWQRWSGGKIIEERCYRGEMMALRISEGILEQGTPLIEALTPQVHAEAQRLKAPVLVALTELIDAGHIEVADHALPLLADELVLASLEAHNPRHALKKLRLGVIHSDRVEEVYCDDLTLEDAFRRALGG